MRSLKTLATRFIILSLLIAAVWIGRDTVMRNFFIKIAEQRIGAKVDIGQLQTNVTDGKVFLNGITFADPRFELKNLFQAKSANLEIDFDALLNRRLVITDGRVSDLVFGAPRSTSGAIHPRIATQDAQTRPETNVSVQGEDPYQTWLDRFKFSEDESKDVDLYIRAAAKDIFSKIDNDLKSQISRMDQLKMNMVEIKKLIEVDDNPLRNQMKLVSARKRLGALQTEIKSVATELAEYDSRLLSDEVLLSNSRKKDRESLVSRLKETRLKGETLSKLLLNDLVTDQTKRILNFYQDFKEAIPNPVDDFVDLRLGKNVEIINRKKEPDFVIRQIQIDGEGRLIGSKFNFSGSARNISTEPQLLANATEFKLRAQGKTHFLVECSLDHKSIPSQDRMVASCPDLELDAFRLGNAETVAIDVSPCRAKINIRLDRSGDSVLGVFQFDYDNLVMQIDRLDELAGGREVADRINLELANLTEFVVQVQFEGPVAAPKIVLQSNLGEKLASKMNSVWQQGVRLAESELDKTYDEYYQHLHKTIASSVNKLKTRFEREIVEPQKVLTADLNALDGPHGPHRIRNLRR